MKYNPHDYQIYAINFIKEHPIAAILLDMGMGKTSIVLAALNDLMFDSFEVTKVLIIAPLRVAKHTWSAEIQKWDQLRGLRYSIAVGTAAERMKALQADADIYIINRENVLWLIEKSGLIYCMRIMNLVLKFMVQPQTGNRHQSYLMLLVRWLKCHLL